MDKTLHARWYEFAVIRSKFLKFLNYSLATCMIKIIINTSACILKIHGLINQVV